MNERVYFRRKWVVAPGREEKNNKRTKILDSRSDFFVFVFCFYLVRRLCFSHFITKILRSLQISVYRQIVPYNVLLKVQLLHILEISTGPIKVADISDETRKPPKTLFKRWMMLYTITVYPVDDAIIVFSNNSRCPRDRARKNKAATVFILLFLINVSKYLLFSFVVSIIGTL